MFLVLMAEFGGKGDRQENVKYLLPMPDTVGSFSREVVPFYLRPNF